MVRLILLLALCTISLQLMGQLNIVDELSYSTVRIHCKLANGGDRIGTGFVMAFKPGEDGFAPVLVTNKHVVKDSISISFVLTEMIDGLPAPTKFPLTLPIGESMWRKHPDDNVDLCALPMGAVINALQAEGKHVKISCLPLDIIASDADFRRMVQLDEVVMIGYPDGIYDEINNQPIFRRGSFATNPALDYNGKKEFVIDIAAYNGSSGSPVFVKYEVSRFDREKRAIVIQDHPSIKLVGVLSSGFVHSATGAIIPVQIPTAVIPAPITAIPNNLGIVIKAERIREMEQLLF